MNEIERAIKRLHAKLEKEIAVLEKEVARREEE